MWNECDRGEGQLFSGLSRTADRGQPPAMLELVRYKASGARVRRALYPGCCYQASCVVTQYRSRSCLCGRSFRGGSNVVMGATYPDLFIAIGVVAGLEFAAATTAVAGLGAITRGGPEPSHQGLLAFQAMHGNQDGKSVLKQTGEITAGSVPGGYSIQKCKYEDGAGRLLMEKWLVEGLGHAWPGSPSAGHFADPNGPNASEEMWRFFCATTLDSLDHPPSRPALRGVLTNLFQRAVEYLKPSVER